eukprot:1314764-Alexandrium_andersonii.AAC.1
MWHPTCGWRVQLPEEQQTTGASLHYLKPGLVRSRSGCKHRPRRHGWNPGRHAKGVRHANAARNGLDAHARYPTYSWRVQLLDAGRRSRKLPERAAARERACNTFTRGWCAAGAAGSENTLRRHGWIPSSQAQE